MKKPKDTSLIEVSFYILLVALITIFEFTYRTQTRIAHDLSSYIVPALAPGRGLGVPYLDYYINRPPGAFVVLKIWEIFLGSQIYSWILLEFILLIAIGLIVHRICRHFTSKNISVVLSVLFEIQLLFGGILDMFLPLELIGIFFILLGVFALINNHRKNINIVLSVSVFTIASLVREQYFCVLFIGVIAIAIIQDSWALRLRSLFVSAIGIAVVLIPMITMLLGQRNFLAFLNIFVDEYETERHSPIFLIPWFNEAIKFHTSNSFNYLGFKSFLHNFLLAIAAFDCISSLFSALFAPKKTRTQVLNFFVKAIGFSLILSVAWQSSGSVLRFSEHYAISSLIGIFLFVLTVMNQIGNTIKLKKVIDKHRYIFKIILILILLPSSKSINLMINSIETLNPKSFFENVVPNSSTPLNSDESRSIQILSQSPKNFRCTMSVYGWDTGAYYFYTNSQPCSRYFLDALLVSAEMAGEYRQDLILNPPRLINYSGLNERFEAFVFPYSAVINECYISVDNLRNISPLSNNVRSFLYISLYASAAEQSSCISQVIMDVHF